MAFLHWDATPKPRRKEGDTREIERFIWWPTVINGEGRWLGWERIRQECYLGWAHMPEGPAYRCLKWRSVEWLPRHRPGWSHQ